MVSRVNSACVDYLHPGSIQITYTRTYPGLVKTQHTDFLDAYPKGDWNKIVFDENESVTYSDFLNTMIHRNEETSRKMCKAELERILNENTNDFRTYIQLMNLICALDPTFTPPVINVSCGWQRQLVKDIASLTFLNVILTCRNVTRLVELFKHLRTI